jgi:hypothetical protein
MVPSEFLAPALSLDTRPQIYLKKGGRDLVYRKPLLKETGKFMSRNARAQLAFPVFSESQNNAEEFPKFPSNKFGHKFAISVLSLALSSSLLSRSRDSSRSRSSVIVA